MGGLLATTTGADGVGVDDAEGLPDGSSFLFHTGVALQVRVGGAGAGTVDVLDDAEGVTAHVGVVDGATGTGDEDSVWPRVGVVLGDGSQAPYADWQPAAQ